MTQDILFREYLNPVKLKEGKDKCPCCGKFMRAYAKTLDKRLIGLAFEILDYLMSRQKKHFTARAIWDNDHNKICDFQKLHYWGIIRACDGDEWELTYKGVRFLKGKIQLPKVVWVFNNKVVLEEDVAYVTVDNADARWQKYRPDYANDFVQQTYQTTLII